MQFNAENKIGALFKLNTHKGDGKTTVETGWFHNIVLETGLNQMSVGQWVDRCCVGSGNSTPVSTQVSLDALIASTTTVQSVSTAVQITNAPYYLSLTRTYRFGQGVAAGNLSEVGLGWGNTSLWNRALIRDSSGNPTTITVLADEYLDVSAEIRVYPAMSINSTFNLLDKSGAVISTHNVTGIPYIASTADATGKVEFSPYIWASSVYSGAMGSTVSSTPIGTESNASNWANTNPTQKSSQKKITLALGNSNFTHKSFLMYVSGLLGSSLDWGYQFQISPEIPKNNTQIMTYTFELSWSAYVP